MMTTFFARRREELRLSQHQVAIRIGITAGAVGQWDREESAPRISLAQKIADVYQVSVATALKEIHAQAERIATKATAAAAK